MLGKDSIRARFITMCFLDPFWTLKYLPDKIIHHVWNVSRQEHRARWILPWSRFNFTKSAAPVTTNAGGWWLMGAIHFQNKCKREESYKLKLCDQIWQAGLNRCTSFLEYKTLQLFLACFCRWEQCHVSLGVSSCLHTELQAWLNRKLFRQKRAAACISYSRIHIKLLRLLVLWLFKQTVWLQWLKCLLHGNEGLFNLYVQLQTWTSTGFLPSLT